MKQYYIGLASSCHDPALAILDADGQVLFAEALERYLQHKRAWDAMPDNILFIPELIKRYCDPAGKFVIATSWSRRVYGLMTFYYLTGRLSHRRLSSSAQGRPSFFMMDSYAMDWVSSLMFSSMRKAGTNLIGQLRHHFGNTQVSISHFHHHRCHAAYACYSSPFEEGVCAIIDGLGEFGSHSFYAYRKGALRRLREVKGYGSLGFLYAQLTDLCGFDWVQSEEWKVMGLAGYGKLDRDIYERLMSLVVVNGLSMRFTYSRRKMERRLAEIRALVSKQGADRLAAADLAYTGQQVFSEIMTKLLNELHGLGISDNLILGGGCALNSSFNGRILQTTPFRRVHIPSAPADDGNALGAAWCAYRRDHPDWAPSPQVLSPFLGSQTSTRTIENMLRFGHVQNVRHLPNTIHQEAAGLLAQGKLVAWVQGRAEFGPRALGNRSILADPRPEDMKDRINALVKFREEFRPFAPSILHEHGDAYFEHYHESPYMQMTFTFRPEVREKVPAVVHVDNTGRVQSVRREWNERYYQLIKEFYRLTGIPLILNTSFNVMGKPIMHTLEDALGIFFTTGLDAMVIDDYLIEKAVAQERPEPAPDRDLPGSPSAS